MTMLAKTTETRALTLADYEARIHLYKEQIGTGYIGIGRTLIEAKEAKVVPHGQWEAWVTQTTGLSPRNAQRCMQAATEIRDGSSLARLEMSKALLLLSSGLDGEEREELAKKAADEGATVKALRDEIAEIKKAREAEQADAADAVKALKVQLVRETGAAAEIREALKKAEADREQLEQQIRARETVYQDRLSQAREDAYKRGEMAGGADAAKEIRQLRNDLEKNRQLRQSLQDQLENARKAKPVQTVPADYEDLKRNQADLLAAAEDAEKRAAEAEAELDALRAGGAGQQDPVWKVLKLATDRFMTDCEMMPLDPAALISDRHRIEANVKWISGWVDMMRKALDAAVPAEGAVI